jgi:hypothetical protein
MKQMGVLDVLTQNKNDNDNGNTQNPTTGGRTVDTLGKH